MAYENDPFLSETQNEALREAEATAKSEEELALETIAKEGDDDKQDASGDEQTGDSRDGGEKDDSDDEEEKDDDKGETDQDESTEEKPSDRVDEKPAKVDAPQPAHEPAEAYVTPPVDDYEKKRGALVKDLAKLHRTFTEGDETLDEEKYAEQQMDIQRRINEMDAQQARHKFDTEAVAKQAEASQKREADAWTRDYGTWQDRMKAAGVDYEADKSRFDELLDAVQLVQVRATKSGQALSRHQVLDKAHQMVSAMRGETTAKAADKPKPRENPPRPKSLANLPSASAAAAELKTGNEFAYMDALDDIDGEIAFRKMSAAEQRRYLNSR